MASWLENSITEERKLLHCSRNISLGPPCLRLFTKLHPAGKLALKQECQLTEGDHN